MKDRYVFLGGMVMFAALTLSLVGCAGPLGTLKSAGYDPNYTFTKGTNPREALREVDHLGLDIRTFVWCRSGLTAVYFSNMPDVASKVQESVTNRLMEELQPEFTTAIAGPGKARYVLFCPLKAQIRKQYRIGHFINPDTVIIYFREYFPDGSYWNIIGPEAYSIRIKAKLFVLDTKDKKVLYFQDKDLVGKEFEFEGLVESDKDSSVLICLQQVQEPIWTKDYLTGSVLSVRFGVQGLERLKESDKDNLILIPVQRLASEIGAALCKYK